VRAGGCRRGVAGGSNDGVNGFNATEDRGEVKRGIRGGGMMAGRVMVRAASDGEVGRRGVAGGDE
jgi:hypothetical protein